MEKYFYVHSKCCNAHWELVYDNGKYALQCETCGAAAGVTVTGPSLTGCAVCQKDSEECGHA